MKLKTIYLEMLKEQMIRRTLALPNFHNLNSTIKTAYKDWLNSNNDHKKLEHLNDLISKSFTKPEDQLKVKNILNIASIIKIFI